MCASGLPAHRGRPRRRRGVGGTLAGNAVSLAAMRATLGEVLTDDAFGPMIDLGTRFNEGVQRVIDDSGCRGP